MIGGDLRPEVPWLAFLEMTRGASQAFLDMGRYEGGWPRRHKHTSMLGFSPNVGEGSDVIERRGEGRGAAHCEKRWERGNVATAALTSDGWATAGFYVR